MQNSVYKQLRWAWSQIIKGGKDYQFVTSAKFEAHGSSLSTIINDLSILGIEFLCLNSALQALIHLRC